MSIGLAGGLFEQQHRKRTGRLPDLSSLDPRSIDAPLLERARRAWQERAQSEFRSVQILSRFLSELVNAGAPLDCCSGVIEAVGEEVVHAELCAAVCQQLGCEARLPSPVELKEREAFLALPMKERALVSAITMLGINETLSVGYIEDLRERCRQPGIAAVLAAIGGDEREHQDFGWTFIREATHRLRPGGLARCRDLVIGALRSHERSAAAALRLGGADDLDACPEPELAWLGLFSPGRQVLVYRRTLRQVLLPRLASLDLLPSGVELG